MIVCFHGNHANVCNSFPVPVYIYNYCLQITEARLQKWAGSVSTAQRITQFSVLIDNKMYPVNMKNNSLRNGKDLALLKSCLYFKVICKFIAAGNGKQVGESQDGKVQ